MRKLRLAAVAVVVVGISVLPSQAQQESTTSSTESTTTTTTESTTSTTAASSSSTSESTTTTAGGDTTTTAPASSTTLSEEERRKKAAAASNLNAARAADVEIAAALRDITEAAQTTQSKVDRARSRLETARRILETANADLTQSDEDEARISEQLSAKAVEGFRSGIDTPDLFFTDRNVNQTLRQTQLLQQANRSTAELLEDLRTLREDRRVAQAEAQQATSDAATLERELSGELATLREQEAVQLRLRGEAQARISQWESALTAYAREDEGIQNLIAEESSAPVSLSPQPREPSSLGFQWPIVGTVTSGYGYRIHPVYGTRKLHSGIDVGSPRGTPISSTSAGTVIFAGTRGGYGRTVIVDHGGGITSLYAHMSQINVSEGTSLDRGDVVGLVGATGTATGNHLHFEIRYNGTATDPAPYLP